MTRRAAVVTVGDSSRESLGDMKLARGLRRTGWEVEEMADVGMFDRFDLDAFSCVFSWHLPKLVRLVRVTQYHGGEVWIGGPAVTFSRRNSEYVRSRTGVERWLAEEAKGRQKAAASAGGKQSGAVRKAKAEPTPTSLDEPPKVVEKSPNLRSQTPKPVTRLPSSSARTPNEGAPDDPCAVAWDPSLAE
jgi:hypothetical protein